MSASRLPLRWRPGRKWLALYLVPAIPLVLALGIRAEESPRPPERADFDKQVRPLLAKYCFGCHGTENGSGGANLAGFTSVPVIQRGHVEWQKALTQVRERSMPPRGVPQPTEAERLLLVEWLAHTLDNIPDGLLPKDPGRVLIHRLSRAEYNNTVRDLFGVDTRPADRFPADGGGGGGFDNNADTLFVPPILMERYLEAAGEILDAAKPQRLFIARPGKGMPPRTAAKRIVEHWAARAFRRPVVPAETERVLRLFDGASKRGESFERAVRFAMKALLISPNFLFRVETDRATNAPYPVGDYELASRLSYFLWSSMPDDALFALAAGKRLREPEVLEAQVRRMLRDPKAAAFADNFASQWLRVRDLKTTARPDPKRYPDFTPTLRDAMIGETVTFFHALLTENRSLLDLLDADYTFLNEELARHYGIPGVQGTNLRRVRLPDRNRGGLLTQASVLTVTSYPQRTSPVLRGKWVLEELLGTPPPPPPPGAGGLPASDAPKDGQTLRQRLEQHRSKPECASCHQRMDPLGFGLENFDAVGRWRAEIAGTPVDSSGVLATGEAFSGPSELKRHLLARKDQFLGNITEKMLAYALGRGIEPYDAPAVRKIVQTVARDGYRSEPLVLEIVRSYPFQFRRNAPQEKASL